MAKRHKSLIELSHDHHHGLAFALRLRQGDNALLNDGWTHDRSEQAKRVKGFYDEELSLHFKEEEDVLFPAMVKEVPRCSGLVATLIEQHRQMERLIAEIATSDEVALMRQLVEFGELLEQHIRSEERSLFPIFESEVSGEVAFRVGEQLGRIRNEILTKRRSEVRR